MAEKKEKQYVSDNARLMAEWDWKKNNELGLNPQKLTVGSGKNAHWKCHKGHYWDARIGHRSNGVGCPYCSGRYAIKGKNDLQTVNPTLAKEWSYEKNNGLTPADILSNSGKKVWWICEKGHEWDATVASRNNGTGCPICRSERHTSFPEYALVYYLKKCGIDIIHSYKAKGYELDVFIPSSKVAIEYDGNYWHKNKAKNDLEKNKKCEKDGITLYRIRDRLPLLNDSSIDYLIQNEQDLSQVIQNILYNLTKKYVDIDLKRDIIAIENLREYTEKVNSLLYTNPELVKEWNYKKNGSLKPEKFTANSGKRVWWICSKGHDWSAVIANRSGGSGCPVCSGQKVSQGFNDLPTINPGLIQEWNYDKNGDVKPEQFTANSGRTVWWKCNNGHDYQARIINKNKGAGCPYCLSQKLLPGYNDLATRNPLLAKEWDYELNKKLTPKDVFVNGYQKVWWKCFKGHPSWLAKITNRNNGRGCPYCSSNRVLIGETDLQTVNPKLVKEWNYEKNKGLTPADVLPNSNKKVWWICNQKHPSWQATIASRNAGMGCPYCSNKKVLQGYNDLATLNLLLAKEWHSTLNGALKPEHVTVNSGKKVWWQCAKGHEWQARIDHRNNGSGCHQCAKEKRIKDKNKTH